MSTRARTISGRCSSTPASSRPGSCRPTACPACSRPGMPERRPRSALYFMYDVKQFDPKEWSSPPLEGRLVDRPEGKAIVGRGAVNQKGPEIAFLSALRAFKATGRKLPVNLVLVAEGEEEIASPHFAQIVNDPEVLAAMRKSGRRVHSRRRTGIERRDLDRPRRQGRHGSPADLERRALGPRPGQGRPFEPHANVDSPAWRLVKALDTLVTEDGQMPAIDGWFENVKPLTARQKQLIAEGVSKSDEADVMKQLGIKHWYKDEDYLTASYRLAVAADRQHRRTGQRLYRPGRQDRPPRPRRGQARPSAGARHDPRGRRGEIEGAPRQARLFRHHRQRQRRVQPDRDRREERPRPVADGGAEKGRDHLHDQSAPRRDPGRA